MNNKKIHEPYNLPTLDDFFERTHGSYMGRVEKINLNRIENFKNHPFKVKDIVSGHRRKRAVELANIGEIPCIVRELTDDEATILMVDSNLQREEILPSEKAFAYKEVGESREQIRRYIRLTNLIPEILQMVDEKKIAFRPAVEISYISTSF